MQYRPKKKPEAASVIGAALFCISILCAIALSRTGTVIPKLVLSAITIISFSYAYKLIIDFVAEDVLYVLPDEDTDVTLKCFYVFKASAKRSRCVFNFRISEIKEVVELADKSSRRDLLKKYPKASKRNCSANLFPLSSYAIILEREGSAFIVFIECEKCFLDALNSEISASREYYRHTDIDF